MWRPAPLIEVNDITQPASCLESSRLIHFGSWLAKPTLSPFLTPFFFCSNVNAVTLCLKHTDIKCWIEAFSESLILQESHEPGNVADVMKLTATTAFHLLKATLQWNLLSTHKYFAMVSPALSPAPHHLKVIVWQEIYTFSPRIPTAKTFLVSKFCFFSFPQCSFI